MPNIFNCWNKCVKNFRWYDISLIKISAAAFILVIAKLYPPLLMLDWYSYFAIGIAEAIVPLKRICEVKECEVKQEVTKAVKKATSKKPTTKKKVTSKK